MAVGLFGLNNSDVVGVATDVLSTDTQKQLTLRVKQEIDAKDRSYAAPEMSAQERARLGMSSPDMSSGFSPGNGASVTAAAGVPLKA